jgi:hypothetical protein
MANINIIGDLLMRTESAEFRKWKIFWAEFFGCTLTPRWNFTEGFCTFLQCARIQQPWCRLVISNLVGFSNRIVNPKMQRWSRSYRSRYGSAKNTVDGDISGLSNERRAADLGNLKKRKTCIVWICAHISG